MKREDLTEVKLPDAQVWFAGKHYQKGRVFFAIDVTVNTWQIRAELVSDLGNESVIMFLENKDLEAILKGIISVDSFFHRKGIREKQVGLAKVLADIVARSRGVSPKGTVVILKPYLRQCQYSTG